MKKNRIILIIAIVLLIGSAVLLLYPEISKKVTQDQAKHQALTFDKMIEEVQESEEDKAYPDSKDKVRNYHEAVEKGVINKEGYPIDSDSGEVISDTPIIYRQDLDRLYQDSFTYNESLKSRQDMNVDFSCAALDLTEYGIWTDIFGYITIPSYELTLAIYLGATDYNMSIGVAHLLNTSLPIGGDSTNAVISGHTGFIGRTFFDVLPYLNIGDEIYLTNFWGTMTYEVTESKIIVATETNDLYIQNGKDLLTLLTCTNAGQQRYLVQCERKQ